ncbi:MAG: hypothetical protein MJY58_04565 [Bacteroidaceae bacterium]|nr:hypothetical protein [Bacteroidaceae bacterium]
MEMENMAACPVQSGSEFLYGRTFGDQGCARVLFTLDSPVNEDALKQAVCGALEEYDFLKLKIERRADGLYWVPNDAPVAVLHTDADILVPSEQTNDHQLVIMWHDNNVTFKFSHALMDGRGSSPLFQSVFSRYFGTVRSEQEKRLGKDDVLADSRLNPIRNEDGAFYLPCVADAYSLTRDGGLEETEDFQYRCIELDEKEFMGRCKSSDGTPNVAMTVLLCRAIKRFQQQTGTAGKNPVINMSADLRSCLGNVSTHWNTIADLHLSFDERMESRDFTSQCTIMRGKLFLESDADTLRIQASRIGQTIAQAGKLPTFEEKDEFYRRQHELTHSRSTALVSYVGVYPFGNDVNSHFEMIRVRLATVWAMLQVEINVASGHFYLTWMQKFNGDVLLNLFLDELRQLGLSFSLKD